MQTNERGFTLVELMVTVAILAILAVIAVPAFAPDNRQRVFDRAVTQLVQDLQAAKAQSISSRQNRRVRFTAFNQYHVEQVASTPIVTKAVILPSGVVVAGVATCVASPDDPSCDAADGAMPGALSFSSTGELSACKGVANCTPASAPASVFLKTADDALKARIVLYRTTGYLRRYDAWP